MSQICNKASVLVHESIRAQVEANVIHGSASFLEAFAEVSRMWSNQELYEVRPTRLEDAKTSCESAIQQLNSARTRYVEVLELVKEHGPRPEAAQALASFEYDGFAEALGLRGGVLWDSFVANAKCANVHGLLREFVDGLDVLIDLLEQDRAVFAAGNVPPTTSFARLMSKWQSIILYGHLSAQVYTGLALAD